MPPYSVNEELVEDIFKKTQPDLARKTLEVHLTFAHFELKAL